MCFLLNLFNCAIFFFASRIIESHNKYGFFYLVSLYVKLGGSGVFNKILNELTLFSNAHDYEIQIFNTSDVAIGIISMNPSS